MPETPEALFWDISVPLQPGIPVWPDSTGLQLKWTKRLDKGAPVNNSHLECDVHVGTHIDAPFHHLANGATAEMLQLSDLIGPAWVVHLPESSEISAADLEKAKIPKDTKRVLFRTRNSSLWEKGSAFQKDYVALTKDAAEWIVQRGIRLVGIDYLSIQKFGDSPETHRILLTKNVVLVEGLNLLNIKAGLYELICLPLRLVGAEGAPARAVLRPYVKK